MHLKDKTVIGRYDNERQPAVKLVFNDKEEANLVFDSIQNVLDDYKSQDILDENSEKVLTLMKRYYKEVDTYEDNKPSTMVYSHMFKIFIYAFIKLAVFTD